MEVYVKELPNSCDECPCCNSDVDYGACCNLGAFDYKDCHQTLYKHLKCPIKSLIKIRQEERSKVCDDIRQNACRNYKMGTKIVEEYLILAEDLENIERGEL